MEKMLVIVLIVMMVMAASAREQRHHPKFPDLIKKEVCSRSHEIKRNKIIEEATCGEPKDVFVELPHLAAHLQVKPGAVWVKRCVGLCPETESNCVALETRTRQIPVRILDVKTNRATCSWFPIEEHLKCGCCSLSVDDCPSPRIFNPRKCSCQCPNVEERRICLTKRNQNMKWNRSKCTCEERNK